MDMKWLELTICLSDYERNNEVLTSVVKPYIDELYSKGTNFHWHYFREPSICWRILASVETISSIRVKLDDLLTLKEKESPELYQKHYFGAFLVEGKEYIGEAELYGGDAWELCYKKWETDSNLALFLCTTKSIKPNPFHLQRHIHLFCNQLGYTLKQESSFCRNHSGKIYELAEKLEHEDS